jgi:hypothetical protein
MNKLLGCWFSKKDEQCTTEIALLELLLAVIPTLAWRLRRICRDWRHSFLKFLRVFVADIIESGHKQQIIPKLLGCKLY